MSPMVKNTARFSVSAPVLISALMCLLVAMPLWSQSLLYRYTSDNGTQVIDDTIPPEFVKNGYDIINKQGEVIQRVPRQLTEEELRDQDSEAARARMREEEERRLREWDESLMLRYSTTRDIEAAQSRAIRDLSIRIGILKSNLKSTQKQIEKLQQEAANYERRNQDVPKTIMDNTATLRLEMQDIQDSIAARNQEIEQTRASFQRDIERFSLLQERVKIRSMNF